MSGIRRGGLRVAAFAVAVVAGVGTGCGSDEGEAGAEDTLSPEAPPLRAVTLAGDSISLAELRGSPVLLNVWATWCAPCRQEIPELQEIHQTYAPQGLRVIGVTVDSRSATADVRQFIEQFGMTYDVWLDPDQSSVSGFGAVGVPLTVLIGPEGRIRWRHLGVLEPGDADLREAIQSVL